MKIKRNIAIYLFVLLSMMGLNAQWNTDRIITIGRNALYFEDFVLSIQYFNQVIKIKPYLSEPYMYRAIAKIQLGDFEGAEKDASEAVERNPFMPQAFYARGFSRMKQEKFKEAAEDFSRALEFSPDSYHLLMSRMSALEQLKDYDGAIRDIDTYLKMSPSTHGLHFEKGRIYLSMNDTLAAEKSFDSFIKADSTSPIGWSAKALVKIQQNKYDEAYQCYSKAIGYKTTNFGDYINRGIINVEKKNYREALSDYSQAIKMEPKSMMAHMNRAILRANLGDDNNAYADFKKVLELDSSVTEARYSLAMLNIKLRKYKDAISEYNEILKKYPYFVPAFWGIAEAYERMGNEKESFRYRMKASDIEKNKNSIQQKMKKDLMAKNMLATDAPVSNSKKRASLFNRNINQEVDENEKASKYEDEKRGLVQYKFVDVVNEKNFVLSYYAKTDELRRTNLYHPNLNQYNRKKVLNSVLKITNQEIPLTSELIQTHFDAINDISSKISTDENNADLYFHRAIEFALVQDFNSSIEDLNMALKINSDFVLAYFMRANIRYKLIDFNRGNQLDQDENISNANSRLQIENQYKIDFEQIMRDYDQVANLQPDFSFSFYNKANILCTQKDFKSAISQYSKAIDVDADFAEAYYNRGLTYLFVGEDAKGLKDLSKAGELGLYGAYNLIQRFTGK